ncbi:MAG TPA: ATP-binding protein, partial [Anaerolineae bacterium]|nr:ATP-binding protein [Anaerolineae bacterium]
MIDVEQFLSLSGMLVHGLLREAIGYTVQQAIPYYHGIVGYVVEAPMLWIRHSRFPILFIAYDQRRPEILEDVVKQLEMGQATEYFALLVVVPTRAGTGNEAEELRHMVADSVYRHDFVVVDRQHLASIIAQSSAQRLVEIVLEQGIELSSLSPYVTKGPVPENMFFGREKEIKAITQTIQHSNYALVGGRQIGKSSILLKLTKLLDRDPRYRALYINCEDKFDYDDLFQSLPDEAQLPAGSHEPLAFRQLAHRLQRGSAPGRLVFLLDEVDELLAFDVQPENRMQLFKSFRSLSHEGACRFVFSGGRTLYQHLHDSQSPFFNFCQELALGPLLAKSVAEIVSKPMHQLGIELPDEDLFVERLIEVSSCHPNLVQWLCDRLVRGAV